MEAAKNLTFDPLMASKAQDEYCEKNDCPKFFPSNGRCYRCGGNIFKSTGYPERGISVEEAGRTLITGCPLCRYSFCD